MYEVIFMLHSLLFTLSTFLTMSFFILYNLLLAINSKYEISFCRSDLVLDLFYFELPVNFSIWKNRVVMCIANILLILYL